MGPNVLTGSKMELQTVLKLMDDAMTAMTTSSGASSGIGTSPTWMDLRGSLSLLATPLNISCSDFSTWAARYEVGRGMLANWSPVAPFWMASRIFSMGCDDSETGRIIS